MSTKTVNVLAPNGRRQNVKVQPDTTILQILEEVCKKQGFQPEDYDVKHHNKVLDTSCPFRFSGLPNNAQLEMAEAKVNRTESEIVLGLQLENGSRLLGNFVPNDNLWDVLLKLCPGESLDTNPVLIYMRKEVYGETLQSTTLKTLGISGGRAMLRLIHKKPEELRVQANVSAVIPSKPVEEKPYRRVLQRSESPPPPQAEAQEETKMVPKPAQNPASGNFLTNFVKREKQGGSVAAPRRNVSSPTEEESGKKAKKEKRPEEKQLEDVVFLGERNALVFSLETSQAIPSEDLPEEFFELTIEDAKKLLRDIKRRRAELENCPLQTSTLRTLENNKHILSSLNRYKKTIIRVQFPDRTVLQGTFLPTETFGDVIRFVRDYLEDRSMHFYVYTTPPKYILDPETRLVEAHCVPTALVHFGCNLPFTSETRFLKSDLLDKFVSSSKASLAANIMREEATRAGTFTHESDSDSTMELTITELDNDVNVGASTSKGTGVATSSQSEQCSKVPKWFNQPK